LFFVRGALVERDPELEGARRPTCTVEEIPGYIWSRSRDGREKDQPVKDDDHGMDAMRYMVAHRDLAEQREVIAVAGLSWWCPLWCGGRRWGRRRRRAAAVSGFLPG